jgi:hypothetical protein
MPEVFNSATHSKKGTVKTKSEPKSLSHRSVNEYSSVMAKEPECTSVFAAFAPKPPHVRFESQADSEHLLLMLRMHPFTQWKWILISFFAAVVPFFFSYFPIFGSLPITYQLGLQWLWYLALFGYMFQSFLKWFYHVYIITDERVIDVDFLNLVLKNITAAKIDHIEDITSETSGFASSFFDYGNIIIQTAAAEQEIIFESVPHPAKVSALLNDLILEEEREKIEGRTH